MYRHKNDDSHHPPEKEPKKKRKKKRRDEVDEEDAYFVCLFLGSKTVCYLAWLGFILSRCFFPRFPRLCVLLGRVRNHCLCLSSRNAMRSLLLPLKAEKDTLLLLCRAEITYRVLSAISSCCHGRRHQRRRFYLYFSSFISKFITVFCVVFFFGRTMNSFVELVSCLVKWTDALGSQSSHASCVPCHLGCLSSFGSV